jgi:hypothetical protein
MTRRKAAFVLVIVGGRHGLQPVFAYLPAGWRVAYGEAEALRVCTTSTELDRYTAEVSARDADRESGSR